MTQETGIEGRRASEIIGAQHGYASRASNAMAGRIAAFINISLFPGALVDAELAKGTRCSMEYRDGMVDALTFRRYGVRIESPYRVGTAAFDAYCAGNVRGHVLWRTLKSEAKKAATAGQEASHV